MPIDEYRNAINTVVYLCSCAVNNVIPEKEYIKDADIEMTYKAAEKHSLVSVVAMSLKKCGITTEKLTKAEGNAIFKAAMMDQEKNAIFAEFETAGIWYLPLKGAIIKDMYPAIGMRQMADFDILVDADKNEEVKNIMLSRGFQVKSFGKGAHDSYSKLPFYNFEIHRVLFTESNSAVLQKYFKDSIKRRIKDEDNAFGYHFSDEDFYLHFIAHEYKHYSKGGTGLRSLLDTYIYLKQHDKLNEEYLSEELEKCGLTEFEKQNKSLAFNLFDGNELTEENRKMFDYIAFSGTYGTMDNRVKNQIQSYGGGFKGKVKYLFRRIFLPMHTIKESFPFFYKHKILIPFLFPYRVITGIKKNGGKRINSEIKLFSKNNKTNK